ncbi:MAG: 50S ribosomal protein L19 [SAR202 cluster bacterium]|nr:50S ribosomal protein L19 [SAR202 cluster bacterium]
MFQAHELVELKKNPKVQNFRPGDTIKVGIRVKEGDRTRTQVFEGVVLRRRGGGPSETFTVRRVLQDIGVERTFHLHSPVVEYVEVLRKGAVKQARLYYLRGRTGRHARIKEKRLPAGKAAEVAAPVVTKKRAEAVVEEPVAEAPQPPKAVAPAPKPEAAKSVTQEPKAAAPAAAPEAQASKAEAPAADEGGSKEQA